MEMLSVQSSQIAQLGHDPEAKQLHILFRRGGLYWHGNTSEQEFQDLLSAESIGKHYNVYFKGNPKKAGGKIEGVNMMRAAQEQQPVEVHPAPTVAPEDENQEVEMVGRRSELLVDTAKAIKITDGPSQAQAEAHLEAIAAMRTEIARTFKPMKEAAFRAHRVVCEQEKKHDAPLKLVEQSLKTQIGSYVLEQRRIALAIDEENRRIERERAEAEARAEADRLAIEDALNLEAAGDMAGAEAVISNPAPVPVQYNAPAATRPNVSTVKSSVGVHTVWKHRVVNERLIPREYMVVNDAVLQALGKTTNGKAVVPGVEFYPDAQVSTGRSGR